jgi:hypothetical protein
MITIKKAADWCLKEYLKGASVDEIIDHAMKFYRLKNFERNYLMKEFLMRIN